MGRPTRDAFTSSRQASVPVSVSDLLPSPTALAARARGGSPPHAVDAMSQLRLPLRSSTSVGRMRSPVVSSRPVDRMRTLLAAADGSQHSLSVTPSAPKARALSTSCGSVCPRLRHLGSQRARHFRALHQLRQPRRTTCPPQRSSSSRFSAIHSRPEHVRCGVRRISASVKAGPSPSNVGRAEKSPRCRTRQRPPSRWRAWPSYLSTRTQRVTSRRPASASRRPTPPPSSINRCDGRAGVLASAIVALSMLVSTALGGKPACASIVPPPCRSPCGSISLASVITGKCCVGRRRGSCSGSPMVIRQGKTARVTLLLSLSFRRGQDQGHGQIRRPPWGRRSRRSLLRLQLWTPVRTI